MEGRSLVPAFDNKPIQRDALFWEHEGNAAIRVGDWKLVRLGRNGAWSSTTSKPTAPSCTTWPRRPRAREELAAKWDAWAERAQVKPYPKPAKPASGKKAAGRPKSGSVP